MDKGHVYILQTLKNLEDQVLADNYPVGKELLHQTKIARELIDKMYWFKSLVDMFATTDASWSRDGAVIDTYEEYNNVLEKIPEQVHTNVKEADKESK